MGGGYSARESRLRWHHVDDFFHMWQSTEFFSVPNASRRGLYPGLLSDWPSHEAPEYLCVSTPSALAYVAGHWLPRGRAESAEAEHSRGLVRVIVLSEWAVLAFLRFLRASLEGMPLFKKCPDPRLLARRDGPIGARGMLFRPSAGLIALIRSVRVAEILKGTAFDARDAEQLLIFAEGMDWSGRPEFVWLGWDRRCTLPMPSGVEAEVGATDGAAALDLADVADAVVAVDAVDAFAVGDASMLPTDNGVAPARGAATDAARSVAGVTAPVR